MKYNGHKNWNHWNVALWIHNDEGLYRLAREMLIRCPGKDRAARNLFVYLSGEKTPDGAPYSYSSIRAALAGFDD